MNRLLVLPVVVPLVAAALSVIAGRRPLLRRFLGLGTATAVLASGLLLVRETADGSVVVAHVGAWPAPFTINLAADLFSALMLSIGGLMTVTCGVFAALRAEDRTILFHPLVLVLLAGISGSFLTADLFNLFVFFEVMLIASYVLITQEGGREQLRGGVVYVATNLFASTLFVASVALTYGAAGTVNLAALGEATATSPQAAVGVSLAFVAFAVKAALVPLHGWVPRAYPVASPAVAALFSGLLTKVGVYALYRVYAVALGGDTDLRLPLLLVASATMAVGVLGAVGRDSMREILSFHITSQIGYMILGLGLFTPLGLAGGIFYILHHIVVKTSLFLSAGAVETLHGTGSLTRLGRIARRRPVLASGFMVAALSLAGLPPLSGFAAKFVLVQASFEGSEHAAAAVAIVVSFLTLLSMLKIWNGAFTGDPEPVRGGPEGAPMPAVAGGSQEADTEPGLRWIAAPAVFLALIAVALGIWPEGLFALSEVAAEGLIDPSAYVEAVLGA